MKFSGASLLSAMINNRLYSLLILGLALVALWVISGGRESTAAVSHYVQKVETFRVSESSGYEVARRFSGRVSARQHADVGFEQGGKLSEVLRDEGELVEQGEVIAVLDTELLRIQQRELEAQLDETRANLTLTENSLKRQQSLRDSGYSSAQRLDELEAQRAALLAAQARLDASMASVSSRIRKSTLLAPFSGVVTHRFADVGRVLGAGMAVVRLQQQGAMEAHIGVPVRLLAHLESGQQLPVSINDKHYPAEVVVVGADVHPVTRTVMVRLALPELAAAVNGDLAYLNLQERVDKRGYWIPATAITDGVRGLWNVYVLKAENEADRFVLEARDIQITHSTADGVFVKGALQSEEVIVAMGLQKLVPGQRVRTQNQTAVSSVTNEPTMGVQ